MRSFEELEVELLDGDEKTLRRLEKALRRAGAADGESRPKVFQALDLDFQPEPVESGDDNSAAGILRVRLREQAEQSARARPGHAARHRLRKSCTSCGWRRGGCVPSSAPAATCSIRDGGAAPRRAAAGSGARSDPSATSTC